jgi:hypothetical protein
MTVRNVFSQTLSGIVRDSRCGLTGSAETAARNGEYVMVRRELRSELVEVVCGGSEASKKNQWPTHTAPIEDFEADTVLYRNRSDHWNSCRTALLSLQP